MKSISVAWVPRIFTTCNPNRRSHKRLKFLLWLGFRAFPWSQTVRCGVTHVWLFLLWWRVFNVLWVTNVMSNLNNAYCLRSCGSAVCLGESQVCFRIHIGVIVCFHEVCCRRSSWCMLTKHSTSSSLESRNFKISRGMPSRLATCRANRFGPCGQWEAGCSLCRFCEFGARNPLWAFGSTFWTSLSVSVRG